MTQQKRHNKTKINYFKPKTRLKQLTKPKTEKTKQKF